MGGTNGLMGGTQDFLDGGGQASMGGQGFDGGESPHPPPCWVTLVACLSISIFASSILSFIALIASLFSC